LAVAIAAGVISACSDAAVNEVTAPQIAATPATPVAEQFPLITEWSSAIPSAIGIQIFVSPRFEDNYQTFVVDANVRFQWANDVSASVDAWLLNKNGQTVNRGSAGMTWKRLALPVSAGDTTFTVRISTNNTTCGLVGKSSYSGTAAQVALDFRLMQITLYYQSLSLTTGPDVTQPPCPPSGCSLEPVTRIAGGATSALAAATEACPGSYPIPPDGGTEDYWVCVTVWRQLFVWDYYAQMFSLSAEWLVGYFCYGYSTIT
jgi:hypothetical protein